MKNVNIDRTKNKLIRKSRRGRKKKGLGVGSVRQSAGASVLQVSDDGTRKMTAGEAIAGSTATRHSGRAFATWLRRSKGIQAGELRTASQWKPLINEFIHRPIGG